MLYGQLYEGFKKLNLKPGIILSPNDFEEFTCGRYLILCYVMLCYVILYYIILYCIMPETGNQISPKEFENSRGEQKLDIYIYIIAGEQEGLPTRRMRWVGCCI
jgi:hypothetical protein